ncbi:PAS domain-containing protein [Halorussus salinisoli]|uniref:PAS domain-containing protein n=1 Tax=Halorussus salinisoli TaxID=2558242 RepID=UPI0010C18FE3|nr:PAS domain S-box protein [Halorussus salinisoli]
MDSGRATPAEVLATLEEMEIACEPITADELADALGCPPEAAAEQLDALVERGDVETKPVGEDGRVWWRPPDSDAFDRERFRAIVQAVEEYAIFMLDPDGHVVTWNKGAKKSKGYGDEILGEHFSMFYTDEDVEAGVPEQNLAAAVERGRTEDEGWRVRKDGSKFWANVVITAIRDDDGTLRGFAKVTRDMTERREREEQLRRERDQTEQLLKTSPVAITVRDDERNVVLANERAQNVLGLSGQELLGDSRIDALDVYDGMGRPLDAEELPPVRVRETGDPVFDEQIAVERPDGVRRWLSVNSTPVFSPDGDLERVITTAEDVTELKTRERELETELSEIFGRISDAFYALDEEFRFTHVNEQAAELLQHSEEELLGKRLWEIFPEAAEEDAVWESFHTAVETQEPTSYQLYFDPLDFWVEANIYPSETGMSVYFRDVTERIQREQRLEESERRYRTLAENFPNGLVTLFDADRRYTVAAGEAFDYLDVSPADVEERVPREVWNDEEVADTIDDMLQSALDGSHESAEVTYAGREWILYAVPVADQDGNVSSGMTMALDITERKEREKRLERFASVISHGLRNPLEIAQIYLNMARDDGNPESFEQVEQALDRMETIIQNLLTTTREGQASDTGAVSLSAVAENAWQTVETADATLVLDEDLDGVMADDDQLQTVLENLFRNAVEHGTDDVTVRVGRLDDDSANSAAGASTDEFDTGFYVADDGPGISPENRTEVFEYGYTSGSGTGIGLAVVRDIVDVHGWDISATEAAEGGARFEIHGVRQESVESEE